MSSNYEKDIIYCFNKTLNEDWPVNIHERTFVSRVAHYLANRIEKNNTKISVDVEYNRNIDIPKKVDDNNRFVDLIIHERLSNNNYVAIEFKKDNNVEDDKIKLINLKKQYDYENIYFICIDEQTIEKYNGRNWQIINKGGDFNE